MNKRILFAILAIAFLVGSLLRWMAGSASYGLMLFFFALLCSWFSFKSGSNRPD
ncbi:hypothetical protein [[Erwinia] mediterraneensis]|uniref:hypothetical protein n=1 Tax=[Erwinia] mediterraneensis TaxID=2161819 RepID=UPI0013EF3948|nr:hypothetical protein [[Erwinia] mediterraneensis]